MLDQKVIVVTGGAGLIGAEFTKVIAKNGGVAIVADIDEKSAAGVVVEALKSNTGFAEIGLLDINKKASINTLIDSLHGKYGQIDAVINNAYPRNKNYGRKFEDVEYDDFCENLNLHLGGYFLVAQQFGAYFKNQGYGHIINMASVYGVMAPRFEIYDKTSMTMPVEYAAIKSAIIGLTKYLAKYYKGTGVRVNSISPGGIADSQPEPFLRKYKDYCHGKGLLDKEDLNGTLLYLLSGMAQYVSGQNLVIDDGFSL